MVLHCVVVCRMWPPNIFNDEGKMVVLWCSFFLLGRSVFPVAMLPPVTVCIWENIEYE